jgi:hypothetical protein
MMNETNPLQMELTPDIIKQIACCKYCMKITEEKVTTPIHCTKYAGSSIPISVNLATCLTCGEYAVS